MRSSACARKSRLSLLAPSSGTPIGALYRAGNVVLSACHRGQDPGLYLSQSNNNHFNQYCHVDQRNTVIHLSCLLFSLHIVAGLNHVLVVSGDAFLLLLCFLSSNTLCTTSTNIFCQSILISRIDGYTRPIIVVDPCMGCQ